MTPKKAKQPSSVSERLVPGLVPPRVNEFLLQSSRFSSGTAEDLDFTSRGLRRRLESVLGQQEQVSLMDQLQDVIMLFGSTDGTLVKDQTPKSHTEEKDVRERLKNLDQQLRLLFN
jgi:hypothetical protein